VTWLAQPTIPIVAMQSVLIISLSFIIELLGSHHQNVEL
jgi:hypothetical protein